MSSGFSQTPRIMDLARRLESDIRERRLKAGDPYLSLTDAARMLGVGSATANRALQLLAQRGMLQRVQRRGTFVGSLEREVSPGSLKRVFMLVHRSYLKQEGQVADGVLVGIQGVLPGADVQFNFLPAVDPTEYVDGLISEILRAKESAGIVLTKVPFVVQRVVKDSGLPAVVNGSLYPSVEGLAWVEQDNLALASLIAGFAVAHGSKHVCALTREVMYPGDNVVLRELGRLLGVAGYKAGAYSICHLPDDPHAIMAEVTDLLRRHPTDLCLVCRSEAKADAAVAAINRLKLTGRRRPRLIVSGLYRRPKDKYHLPYVFPTMRAEEIGTAIGRLLAAQVMDPKTAPGHITVPVALSDS
ncbi:MAG: winged helix-turn-helix domain-containing protein [Opitutaceae bacterium]